MLNVNLKKAVAGVFAAQLALAMAPMTGAQAPAAHFINDQGELVSVDSPDPSRQPIFVAIPLAKAPVQQGEKSGASGR